MLIATPQKSIAWTLVLCTIAHQCPPELSSLPPGYIPESFDKYCALLDAHILPFHYVLNHTHAIGPADKSKFCKTMTNTIYTKIAHMHASTTRKGDNYGPATKEGAVCRAQRNSRLRLCRKLDKRNVRARSDHAHLEEARMASKDLFQCV